MIYIDIDMHIFYMQPPKMSVIDYRGSLSLIRNKGGNTIVTESEK